MRSVKLTVVFCCFLLAGCSVLRISQSESNQEKAKDVAGVPFYSRAGACKSETVWLQPVYVLRLVKVTTQNAKETLEEFGSAAFSREGLRSSDVSKALKDLRKELENGSEEGTIRKKWGEIMKEAASRSPDRNLKAGDVSLVSNTNSLEAYVDYSTKYYYNVRRPLVGSAKAEFKLNTDGTLGEGKGEVESKTVETFLSLFALKEIIEKAAGVSALAVAAPTYRLIMDTKVFRISWYTYSPIPASRGVPCPAPTAEPIFSESCPGGYNCKRDEAKPEDKGPRG